MNNRVRHLDLRLSLPPELRQQSWIIAEQLRDGFISEVVERIAERLHAQFGADALIEIPLLEVRWDGKEQTITDFDYAKKLGDEVADEMLSEFDTQTIDRVDIEPSAFGGLRVYRSQAHKAAVIVSARARQQQRSATIGNLAALEQEWQTLCEQGNASVADGVRYICELGAAETVVESLSTPLIQAAVAVCPLSRWLQPIRSIVATRLLQAAPEHAAGRQQEPQTEQPVTTRVADEGPDVADKNAALPSVAKVRAEQTEKTAGQGTEPINPEQAATPGDRSSETQWADTPQRIRHKNRSGDAVSESPGGVARIDKDDWHTGYSLIESVAAEAIDKEQERLRTHYAGLVYMLNLIMRIELPEILWCCGIDEGSFLFDLCRHLAGDGVESDPVLTAIAGIKADRSNYQPVAVPDWAWCEVVQKVHTRLQHLLPSASQYAFSDEDVMVLTESSYDEETSWQQLFEATARLLVAGFLDLVRADAGVSIGAYLYLQGYVKEAEEKTTIGLPMESIDIDVRRAALDLNPSYLQWTGQTLVIAFA